MSGRFVEGGKPPMVPLDRRGLITGARESVLASFVEPRGEREGTTATTLATMYFEGMRHVLTHGSPRGEHGDLMDVNATRRDYAATPLVPTEHPDTFLQLTGENILFFNDSEAPVEGTIVAQVVVFPSEEMPDNGITERTERPIFAIKGITDTHHVQVVDPHSEFRMPLGHDYDQVENAFEIFRGITGPPRGSGNSSN